ncbi:MAG: SCP2 sterol-binding domain-containing protein [Candidatus Hydrogenedentes bacterium]|nr:SCP2 sterol-binding domain-containing protein [Candidatus Hydrogenedentota bacterium]
MALRDDRNPGSVRPMEEAQEVCGRYFSEFLPQWGGRLLLPELASLSCVFGIVIEDIESAAWVVEIERGRLVRVRPVSGDLALELEAQATFVTDHETFLEVVSAKTAPSEAFFSTLIDIAGDMELGLSLSTVLEPFFRAYPFRL